MKSKLNLSLVILGVIFSLSEERTSETRLAAEGGCHGHSMSLTNRMTQFSMLEYIHMCELLRVQTSN